MPDRTEAVAALALTTARGYGATRIRLLVERFGSAGAAIDASPHQVRDVAGLSLRLPHDAFAKAHAWLDACRVHGIRPIAFSERDYPALLRPIHDPPPVLFVRGELPTGAIGEWSDVRTVAVVGTRDPTARARRFSADLGRDLAGAGIVVVSGLALGVDGAAHEGALSADGAPPLAVLAGGLDRVRPAVHAGLASRILAAGGALVSEDPPAARAYGHRFVARNRIVSGLSRAVVVVEAGARSGALHTAGFAVDQGRMVFVVPDHPTASRASGNLRLLAEGAVPVTRTMEVPEHLQWEVPAAPPVCLPERSARLLVDLLRHAPCTVDGLAGDPVRNLVGLAELEMAGFVVRDGSGRFRPTRDGIAVAERSESTKEREPKRHRQ